MIISQSILSFIKSITAIISALIIMVSGSGAAGTPVGAEIIAQTSYAFIDADTMKQGVTNDGTYYYFSSKDSLGKAEIANGQMITINTDAIPDELKDKGCNHIGGLSYYNGYIYAAVEDGPNYLNSFIVLYKAYNLEYSGFYYEVPHELHLEGVPWCAVDVENDCIYTAEWSNATVLNIFNLKDLSLKGTLPLSEPIDRIQGAEVYNGKLYLSCDEQNDQKRILSLDVATGKVETAFIRNIGNTVEAEDITITVENGKPVFHVIDIAENRNVVTLTSYSMT